MYVPRQLMVVPPLLTLSLQGVPTYIPLTEIAYSLLTGRTPHFDDLVHLDQAFYRSLLHLKRQQTGIEDLLLNFTISINCTSLCLCLFMLAKFSLALDAVTTKELKPHGHDIPVTAANKNEYIALVAFYKIALQFEQQFAAFKRGFHRTQHTLVHYSMETYGAPQSLSPRRGRRCFRRRSWRRWPTGAATTRSHSTSTTLGGTQTTPTVP